MNGLAPTTALWGYSQTARILGLSESYGRKVVAEAVKALKIEPNPFGPGTSQGLTRADIDRIATWLDKTVDWS